MTSKLAILTMMALIAAGVARAEGYDPIETRQAGQDLVSGTFAGIRAVVNAKGDVKTLENPAKAMQRWATSLPTLFPKGTEQGHNTKALAEVWSDQAGFQKASMVLADAAGKLSDAAKAGDLDTVAGQVKVVGDACTACHRTYRAK